ncbi:hypothetical protein [Microbacterium panaciterrae]|uniref:Secreted protein n=1 Tax=Microbacterium panaciterrae TaxID=985759 RepID=A0ABP8P0I2_9MICO
MRKRVLASLAGVALVTVGMLGGASGAYASDPLPDPAPDAAPAPDYEDTAPNAVPSNGLYSPMGDFITSAQMDAIPSSGGEIALVFPDAPPAPDNGASGTVPVQVSGSRCYLVPGVMWSRSSGSGYTYGTIGSKPQLTNCTADVKKTGMASEVWKNNGWIWSRVAGPFNSYGTGNMQQKSVQYICKNKGSNLYKVVTTSWGTNSRGQTGVGRDSTGPFRFSCG